MYHYFLKISFLLLAIVSISVNAKPLSKQDIPVKVFDYIAKKHPQARDFKIQEKTHFGQPLYEVSFIVDQTDKNGQAYQETVVNLFRVNGRFYSNALVVEHNAFNIIPSDTEKNLQSNYPNYEILAMKTVVNPNGVGEEYDVQLLVSGKIMDVSINSQGKLIGETQLDK